MQYSRQIAVTLKPPIAKPTTFSEKSRHVQGSGKAPCISRVWHSQSIASLGPCNHICYYITGNLFRELQNFWLYMLLEVLISQCSSDRSRKTATSISKTINLRQFYKVLAQKRSQKEKLLPTTYNMPNLTRLKTTQIASVNISDPIVLKILNQTPPIALKWFCPSLYRNAYLRTKVGPSYVVFNQQWINWKHMMHLKRTQSPFSSP